MKYKTISPPGYLEPFVHHFWVLDITTDDLPYAHHLTPYGRLELFFYLNQPLLGYSPGVNSVNRSDGIFTGFFKESILLNHYAPFRAAGISFQPWAGSEVFQIPANNFSNKSIPFSDIDPHSKLRSQILEAKTEKDIVSCFVEFLSLKLKSFKVDPVSAFLTKEILKNPTDNSLYDTIVPQIGLSKRRIQQRFLNSVGVSMGFFHSLSRFEKSLELITMDQNHSLTEIGFQAGYYDQSHFIGDFKRFARETPSSFVKRIATKDQVELSFLLS